MNSIDVCALKNREKILTKDFILHVDKWDSMDCEVKRIVSKNWSSIKYLDVKGNLSPDIKKLPDDSGGIYLFLLSPDIINGLHRYIMYIGRARKCNEFSLQKRCRCYIKDTRPLIAEMIGNWGQYLYLYYLPLESDEEIVMVERELNRVIIPPCNTQIPDRFIEIESESKEAFT